MGICSRQSGRTQLQLQQGQVRVMTQSGGGASENGKLLLEILGERGIRAGHLLKADQEIRYRGGGGGSDQIVRVVRFQRRVFDKLT